jgi:NAD-dependent SIR2 family protein deacetylase
MADDKSKTCECALCGNDKQFTVPEHLIEQIAKGNVIVFAGAGISTEAKDKAQHTFYEAIAHELGIDGLSFPSLMSRYCSQPDGRIKLLSKIKDRFEYFKSFEEFYFSMSRFHRSLAPIHTITDVITTNWDDFFERECEFDPFIYDSDLAFWDSSPRRLMKIHGSITNFGSIIATEKDYEESFARLNSGPLGSHLKSLISRKTVIYVGYSLSDENYIKILSNICEIMWSSMRQSYFVSPYIDPSKLEKLPLNLIPIQTDGAYFFEQIRTHLEDKIGIVKDVAFDEADELLDIVIAEHLRASGRFQETKHPLLAFCLSYQDGLRHALKRMKRKRKSGHYHDLDRLHSLIHSYTAATTQFRRKRDHWNAEYARGYLNALIFLHESNAYDNIPLPPLYWNTVTDASASLSSIIKYPRKKLPKSVLRQFEKMPIIDAVTGETMIPDHTPYLGFPIRSK